jgi:hypothetical protein
VGNEMNKKLKAFTLFLAITLAACATTPEQQLYDRFNILDKKDVSDLDPEELRWLGMSHFTGLIKAEGEFGITYFRSIPINHQRTFQLLDEGGRRNDPLALGLLGLLHRQGVGAYEQKLNLVPHQS